MSDSEQTRRRVYARLREALGEEAATTLMSDRPPFDWSEVATKTDLVTLRDELRGEMASLRNELRGEVHGETGALRAEMGALRGEMGGLRGELGQVEARLSGAIATQTRYYVATTVGAVLATGALAFTAAGLG